MKHACGFRIQKQTGCPSKRLGIKSLSYLENMSRKIVLWLGQRLRSRYVRMLEDDVARLRAENRALVNSLLGTAGFPPVSIEDDLRRGSVALPAVRKRTWTQIARERELAAGREALAGRGALERGSAGRAADGK
jgi:hypothetical protein